MTLLALDWGTSSLRAALLDERGTVLQERSSPDGILNVPAGEFPAAFESILRGWPIDAGMPCVASGMVGSRQGWLEAPYCPCPAGAADLARRIAWVADAPLGMRLGIAPGLSTEVDGVPDVMRGEEVQVFGALQLLGLDDGLFVLPGTHSKWVRVQASRVVGFSTFMTGEFYALLRKYSILGRTMPAEDGALDDMAFLRGIEHGRKSGSLLHAAFSARTLALFSRLATEAVPSYLSGLVIGEELRAQSLQTGQSVVVIGNDALTLRYRIALEASGLTVTTIGAQATWRGLLALAALLKGSPP